MVVSVIDRMTSAPASTSSRVATGSSSGLNQLWTHSTWTRASGLTERTPCVKAFRCRTVSGMTTGPTAPIRSVVVMSPASFPIIHFTWYMRPK